MSLRTAIISCCLVFLFTNNEASAHFGAIIPATETMQHDSSGKLSLAVSFLHPMEMHYMHMEKPVRFAVAQGTGISDLTATLEEVQQSKGLSWKAEYTVKRPGDYTFFVEPQPYWEPAEDVFIIHYTKVCVNGFGLEQGWDKPVGLETEIVPLTRPYGLWTGNLFTGQVLLDGKPVPHAEVEIEHLNSPEDRDKMVVPPAEPFITQVLKADSNGIFSYAMPKSGWWGFAALNEANRTIKHEGTDKGIELGAVFWVHARDMK